MRGFSKIIAHAWRYKYNNMLVCKQLEIKQVISISYKCFNDC